MSHVAKVEVEIKDLTALETACNKLGVTLERGQKTWVSYYGTDQCEHAITVPNSDYSVGVIKNENGTGFHLKFDSWGKHGRGITERVGDGCLKLSNEYSATVATRQLVKQGFRVRRSMQAGRIVLKGER